MIAIDIETKDPGLKELGPGTHRGEGFITSIGVYDGKVAKAYHPDDPEVKALLASDEMKITHNGLYDLEWLDHSGLKVNGVVKDTLIRESLIYPDANGFSLDASSKRHGLEGKNFGVTVEDWWKEQGFEGEAIKNMDKVPFNIQAEYVKGDVETTYRLFEAQENDIIAKELEAVDKLETDLIPVVLRMRQNGIRIDTGKRDTLKRQYLEDVITLEDDILMESGIVNINSSDQIGYYYHQQGVKSPFLTPKGGESWDKNTLAALDDPVAHKILKAKHKKTLLTTFLSSALQKTSGDRLYTQFHQTHRDEGGTITGRFSSSTPNLQNIPAKGKDGKEIRSIFLPDEGCVLGAYDYKQVEYRLFAHYALLWKQPGWVKLQQAMAEGKDYHAWVMEMLDWEGEDMRKLAKTLNFGILYGMGKVKCLKMNRSLFKPRKDETPEQYADWVYDTYFGTLTFVRPTCQKISRIAQNVGYVRGLDGRIHITQPGAAYKSVNYLIQGSAAGLLKMGMVDAERAGIWNVLPLHLTVHDELVFSIPATAEGKEAARELGEIMKTKLKLEVPIGVDTEVGEDWANVSGEYYERFVA